MDNKAFRLLGLPLELRRLVYGWAFANRGHFVLDIPEFCTREHRTTATCTDVFETALCQVSHQINDEAMPVLLSQSRHFRNFGNLHKFLIKIGSKNRSFLKDICVSTNHIFSYDDERDDKMACIPLLCEAPRLKLHIMVVWCSEKMCIAHKDAEAPFIPTQHFLEATEQHQGKRDAAVDSITFYPPSRPLFPHFDLIWTVKTVISWHSKKGD